MIEGVNAGRVRPVWFLLLLLAAVAAAATLLLVPEDWPLVAQLALAAVGAIAAGATGSFLSEWLQRRRADRAAAENLRRARVLPSGSRAGLLIPSQQIVEFVGRSRELADLIAWCEHETKSRVRLITGPGGVGKTRLAVELCAQLRELGWRCEHVGIDAEASALDMVRAVTSARTLLVVDYAETRAGLPTLLKSVALEGDRVRLLLLARSTGEWWERLRTTDPGVRELMADAHEGNDLTAQIDSGLTDGDVVASAVPQFAKRVGVQPPPSVDLVAAAQDRRPVLDLHAAALVAVLRGVDEGVVRVDVGDVLTELLVHEEKFWFGTAERASLTSGPMGMTLNVMRQIVAASSLLGAANEADALALLERVPGAVASKKVVRWLRELYPAQPETGEWLGSLQPDRLAERHVVAQLHNDPDLTAACLTALDDRQALRAITLLGRASTDPGIDARPFLTRALPFVERIVAALPDDLDLLQAISAALPPRSDVLAGAELAITQRILKVVPVDARAKRGAWLGHLGATFGLVGQPERGLNPTKEALGIFQDLAGSDPGYRPYLAGGLVNLGSLLAEVGRPNDALLHAEQAVRLYQELMAVNPDRHRAELAGATTNLGRVFSALGHRAEALQCTEDAVAILRELVEVDPDRYQLDLAGALTNLGSALSELGRPADARPHTEEAVRLCRELVAIDPDRYRVHLAAPLANLGVRLAELGRPDDARPCLEEAVGIYGEQGQKYPDRYLPNFALSSSNLGRVLVSLRRHGDALPHIEKAVGILRTLDERYQGRYRSDLTGALTAHGATLWGLRRGGEALQCTEDTVAILRELVEVDPDRHHLELLRVLSNLRVMYLASDRPADALSSEQETVEVYRVLAGIDPDGFLPELAKSLVNVGGSFWSLERPAEALTHSREALGILSELNEVQPGDHTESLAGVLMNLGVQLTDLGRASEALPNSQEAVRIYRELDKANPGRYSNELASSLANLGGTFFALGRSDEALECVAAAEEITRAAEE